MMGVGIVVDFSGWCPGCYDGVGVGISVLRGMGVFLDFRVEVGALVVLLISVVGFPFASGLVASGSKVVSGLVPSALASALVSGVGLGIRV